MIRVWQIDLNWYGHQQQVNNIVGSDTQAVTAVTVARLTYEIIDDTFGFWYSKLSINNKKNLKFWQIIFSFTLIYKQHNKRS